MSTTRTLKTVYVISQLDNLGGRIQSMLDALSLDIRIKEYPLSQYGKFSAPGVSISVLKDMSILEDQMEDVECLLADIPVVAQVLQHPKNRVKWAQSTFAGVDNIFSNFSKLKLNPDLIITRTSSDKSGQMMGEYVIGHIIARERDFLGMAEHQKKREYAQHKFWPYRILTDLSIGILGLGNLGTDVARMTKALGMTTWAILRDERFSAGEKQCPHVDHVRPMSRMSEALSELDYLVSFLPSTPSTKCLLSGDALKPCSEKKTVFINLGRGDVIDDKSLENAVNKGWLGGAILDVYNEEPLPSDSPLWTLPGVTNTPHVSCCPPDISMYSDPFVDNLLLYLQGQTLHNEVDITKGY